jgi:hypothetical protein
MLAIAARSPLAQPWGSGPTCCLNTITTQAAPMRYQLHTPLAQSHSALLWCGQSRLPGTTPLHTHAPCDLVHTQIQAHSIKTPTHRTPLLQCEAAAAGTAAPHQTTHALSLPALTTIASPPPQPSSHTPSRLYLHQHTPHKQPHTPDTPLYTPAANRQAVT